MPATFMDERGWFSESFNARNFAAIGIQEEFVQDNHSYSEKQGTVRGMHYQLPPNAQAKLIRALRGSVLSIAVDIRRSSPAFGQHVAVKLDARAGNQLYIPAGFAHGFCTLEPQVEVLYKASAFYAPASERGINWKDPRLKLPWPVEGKNAVLSPKDVQAPMLAEQPDLFD
jgi:dTDP-4-dehydrorhamnose 3,5-epimerase